MAIPFEVLTPHVPMHPFVGAVVAGKVMAAQSQVQTGHTGRFVVIDPIAETIRAFQMTPPAGFSFGFARFGDEADGALWMACTGTYLMLVEMYPDGSYFTHPSSFGGTSGPWTAVHVPPTNEIWCINVNTSATPRIFDLSTRAWSPDTPTSGTSFGQPLYAAGAIWCPIGGQIINRYDVYTRAKTTPVSSGGPVFVGWGQGVVNGDGVAIWTRGSGTGQSTLHTLDLATATPGTMVAGVPFYAGLAISDAGVLYSVNAAGSTIAKHSLTTGSDAQATGVTGGSNGSLTFWAGRGVSPVWKA